MANEAIIVDLLGYPPGEPAEYSVASGVNLSKGTWMILSGGTFERTMAASSTFGQPFVGILAHDKDASDGATTGSVYTNCIVDGVAVAGAAANLPIGGYPVELSGANLLRLQARTTVSGGEYLSGAAFTAGKALKTPSASEVFQIRVRA